MFDIYARIEEGYYNNKAEAVFHKKPNKACPHCGKVLQFFNNEDMPNHCHNCGSPFADYYKGLLADQQKKQKAFQDEQRNKKEQFKSDALEYCGLTNHEKADKAFEFAWNEGHSSGLHEVVDYLETVSELML